MNRTFAVLLLAMASAAAHAQAAGSAPGAAPPEGRPAVTAPDGYARQMAQMQQMHERMQAARTPQERQALLDEHTRLMRSGMEAMKQMRPGAAATGAGEHEGHSHGGAGEAKGMGGMMGGGGMMDMHGAMERRVALLEQMLQMLVDRQLAAPAK